MAIMLILLALALGVPRAYLEWTQVREQFASTPHVSTSVAMMIPLFTFAIILGLMLWLIWMIGRGRNWARITYLILFLLGLPFSIGPLVQSFSLFPLSASIGLAQMLLQIVALVLLFTGAARRWFSAPPAPPSLPA